MTDERKQQIAALMDQEHLLVLTTNGEEWPSVTLQAFAETPEFDVVLIMSESSERFQNIKRSPKVAYLIESRGDIARFMVRRLSARGLAREVAKESPEWNQLKTIFLEKNRFEEPFFGNPALRMVRIAPKSMKYADGLNPAVQLEF